MNTVQKPMYEWKDINWRKLERSVFKLQKRIYRASNRGDVKLVGRLQRLLISSSTARALAVRRVTQENQGKKTAGVDGVKSLTPKQRLTLIDKINLGSKVKPTRRVWIPKPGTEEKRPLGIPTMEDRALQALVKLALEPEWEARFEPNSYGFRPGRSCHDAIGEVRFEPNSYGFRPGRSCHDAIGAIYISINKKPKWVLDADISKCFDKINHQKLLDKLNTYPSMRRLIRSWLKAGVMGNEGFQDTNAGTPQGGVISPLLANIALHGLENVVKHYADKLIPGDKSKNRKALNLIRYADDFVVMHKDLNIIEDVQRRIRRQNCSSVKREDAHNVA
ncbi:MAG: RNA-directed DNA polymerase [Symploca sp. SIO2E9]|nr:RNA-directed DNA polymerase [Symploca sp. SIO2E9]